MVVKVLKTHWVWFTLWDSNCFTGFCGCHLDRHENIGKGKIGISGFQRIMNDNRLNNLPFIIEVPKIDDAHEIKTLYSLCIWFHYFMNSNCFTGLCGCHLDRHENIGKGKIGLNGFRRIMNDDRLNNLPFVVETPYIDYAREIKTLYKLCT